MQAQELEKLSPELLSYLCDVWAGDLEARQILDFFEEGEISLEEVEAWVLWIKNAAVPEKWPDVLLGDADLDCVQILTLTDGSQLYLRWDPFCEAGCVRAL